MFTKQNLERHCKEAEKRVKIADSFKEPDRVPINISEYGSYWSGLFGYNIRDYYTDPELSIEVGEKGLTWRFENLKDDRAGYGLSFDLGIVGESLVFDCPVEYPDDTPLELSRF